MAVDSAIVIGFVHKHLNRFYWRLLISFPKGMVPTLEERLKGQGQISAYHFGRERLVGLG